ncbi:MAG TPA: hypothetical protein VFE22_08620, partial [Edaphobacter sp.]|nr:hypothetical protein [Edaphobacter sp.]
MQQRYMHPVTTTLAWTKMIVMFLCAVILLAPLYYAYAQEEDNGVTGSKPNDTHSASPDSNAALLQELEAMRKRIEQLEAQVKAQSAATLNTGAVDAATPLQTSRRALLNQPTAAIADPSTTPSPAITSASVEKSETPIATHAKAAPFAFADFTWLNGNPRTKEPAFDSKFFTP